MQVSADDDPERYAFQASDIPVWMPVLVGKSVVAAVR
jgi:hypothetical protein